jgi:hypothetical protein
MLTEKEEKELSKLSPEFRDKLIKIFSNPNIKGFVGFKTQFNTWADELRDNPQPINGKNADDDAIQRSKAETALKLMKEMFDLSATAIKWEASLTEEEKKEVNEKVKKSSTVVV